MNRATGPVSRCATGLAALLAAAGLAACEAPLAPFDACYTTSGPDGPHAGTGNRPVWRCRAEDHLRVWADGRYEVVFRRYSTFEMRIHTWEEAGHYRLEGIVTLRPRDGPVLHFARWTFAPLAGDPWSARTHATNPHACDLVVERAFPDIPPSDPVRPLVYRAEGPLRPDECWPL